MKLARRILLGLFLAVAAVVLVAWLHGANTRRGDAAYHATLLKTVLVTSNDFPADGDIPVSFTCKGSGLSPELSWKGSPANVKSYALVVSDFDVPSPNFAFTSFTHWIVYNIAANQQTIRSAIKAAELRQAGMAVGTNSSGERAYKPPCPPFGNHRYEFRVYALDVAHLQPASDEGAALLEAMRGHILAYGELVGLFAR